MQVERALLCLRETDAVVQTIARAFAALRPWQPLPIDVVAAPAHELHGAPGAAARMVLGDCFGTIHLVPTPRQTIGLAAELADARTLVVGLPGALRRWPGNAEACTLAVNGPVAGRSVLVAVDPGHDSSEPVLIASALAHRLEISIVHVCHVFFDETAAACDAWEERALARECERLDIYLARVPTDGGIRLSPLVVQGPDRLRSFARLAEETGAALAVGPRGSRPSVPVLTLPERRVALWSFGSDWRWAEPSTGGAFGAVSLR